MTDGFSAPGGAIYNSSLMYVGDGTWDSTKNDFLLPNIQGLNFQTMRYNGMGNRFSSISEYHSLVLGHGILAAITFLGVVPVAILIAAFYSRNPHLALRIHISLQIMTLILATVVFVLGYFAVGPERSLTNPHHGIGVAIYVLVWVQVIGGALVHRIEKGKEFRGYIPMKLMLHQWLGRAIALLAIAQIPIGLTLYGSPLYLFILYAVLVFGYVVFYFFMTYWRQKRNSIIYDNASSVITGDRMQQESYVSGRPQRSGVGGWAEGAAGGTGFAALRRRFSGRRRDEVKNDQRYGPGAPSQYTQESDSYLSEKSRRGDGWGNRFLYAVGGAGAYEGAKRFFRRRDRRDDDMSYSQPSQQQYPPPTHGRPPMTNSQLAIANAEEGRQQPANDWERVEQMERAQAAQNARQSGYQPPQQQIYTRPAYPPGMGSEMSSQGGARYDRPGNQRRFDDEQNADNRNSGVFEKLLAATGIGGILERRRSRKEDARNEAERRRRFDEHRQGMDNEHQPLVRPGGNQQTVPNVMESPTRQDRPIGPMPPTNQYNQYNQPTDPGSQIPAYSGPVPPRPRNNGLASPVRRDWAYGPAPPPPSHNQQAPFGSPQGDSRRTSTSQHPPRVAFAEGTAPGSPSPSRPPQRPGPPPMQAQQQPPVQPPPTQAPPQQPFSRFNSSSSLNAATNPPISLHVRDSNSHVHVRRLSPEEAGAERKRRAQPANIAANLPAAAGPSQPNQAAYQQSAQAPPTAPPHLSSPVSQVTSGATDSAVRHETARQQRKAERVRNEQARQGAYTGRDGRVNYN